MSASVLTNVCERVFYEVFNDVCCVFLFFLMSTNGVKLHFWPIDSESDSERVIKIERECVHIYKHMCIYNI